MSKKKTLHIYTRVSTGVQEDEGTSLETQLEEGIKRSDILKMSYKLWNEGGESGSKGDLSNRPKLVELLNLIDSGEVKHLYVWNTDRLSRNLETWGMIRVKLIQNDVTLHTPTGKQQLSDPTTNLMLGIMSEFSQYDNQLRSERFRLGKLNKIKKGFWKGGPPPYGYDLNKGLLQPNKIETKWVGQMFEWYLKGNSIPTIKDKLLQNGVITRRGNPIWSEGSIQNVLTENTHYQGFWNYHDKKSDENIRVECPTIISPETILKVKKLHKERQQKSNKGNRRPDRKHTYLLKDILVCGNCGGFFSGWKSSNKQQPYYFCRTGSNNSRRDNKNKVECTSRRNLNMNNTDKLVWDVVRDVITKSNIFKESIKNEVLDETSIVQTEVDVKKIERKLKVNENLIKRVTESIVNQETDKLIGIRSSKEIQSVLDKLDTELLKLKSNKEKMLSELSFREQNSQWVDWVKEWGSRLNNMKNTEFKFEDKKKFLNTIVEKIIVKSDDKIEHELTIRFKLPYVNDELIYKDDNNKGKGYILKDGSYSKKLRITSLKKKLDLMSEKCLAYNNVHNNFFNTTQLL